MIKLRKYNLTIRFELVEILNIVIGELDEE